LNLADPGTLKGLLGRHGISASKGLGQHFLVSRSAVDRIAASVSECRGILEIGPGPGVLTSLLSISAEHLIALELDPRMKEVLVESSPKADVRLADALEIDIPTILNELPKPRAVVSNLPYYITGPLLTRVAEARGHFDVAVLMMQKEVGERVLAAEGTSARGSLSVYLQLQFDISRLALVPAGAFLPPPKVDSIVLKLVPKTADIDHKVLSLVRLGFTQPRKTLANNLGASFGKERVQAAIERLGWSASIRPQQLANSQWLSLADDLLEPLAPEGHHFE
jgi:16S rRNA (adenine1518-N6/adenine1519-N6)-dimethyltransferase